MNENKEYYAFISYKREDEKWAKWLQDKLEHYKFPTNLNGRTDLPKSIRPTFRDVTDLNPGLLAEEINKALRNSEWLIVVCSPRSAKSPWVCKEAQTFIDLGRADHIIPFVIEGNPFSNDSTECYPEALLNLTGSKELLAANINEMGRDAAAVKVVARMFNIRFDSLWQRYEKERRKRRFYLLAGVLALAIMAFGVAGWLWSLNKQLTNKNRQLSIENVKFGSRQVNNLLEYGNYVDALHELWSLTSIWDADYREEAPEFEQALRTMHRYEHSDGISKLFSIPISYDQRYLTSDTSYIYVSEKKEWQYEILRYDINTGEYAGRIFPTESMRDSALVMELKGQKVLYSTSHSFMGNGALRLYDLATGIDLLLIERYAAAWILSDDCIFVNLQLRETDWRRMAALITIGNGQVLRRDTISLPFYPEKLALKGDSLIIANGSRVATWLTRQQRWTNQMTYRAEDEQDYVPQNVLALDANSSWMANLRQGYGLVLFNTDHRDSLVINPRMMEASVAFNPSGTLMAVSDIYSDSLVVYATENMMPLFRLSNMYLDDADIEFADETTIVASRQGSMLSLFSIEAHFDACLLYSPDGSHRLELSDNGKEVDIVNDSTGESLLRITYVKPNFRIFGFSPHGRYLKFGTTYEFDYSLIDCHTTEVTPIVPRQEYNAVPWLLTDCFSDDENTLVLLWKDNHIEISDTLEVFDIKSGSRRKYGPGMRLVGIALNHDGSLLAMNDGNTVSFLQIDSLSIHPRHFSTPDSAFSVTNSSIRDLCFTPNGQHIIVACSDGSIRQWDIESGQTSAPVMRSNDVVAYNSISVSPDGQYLVGTTELKNNTWVHDIWHIPSGLRVDRLTDEWSWFMRPYISTYYSLPNYEASFSKEGLPRIIINEKTMKGLSRTFSFPSFEQLVDIYTHPDK